MSEVSVKIRREEQSPQIARSVPSRSHDGRIFSCLQPPTSSPVPGIQMSTAEATPTTTAALGTTDDDIYNDVDEIDAVRFVGPRTIDRMIGYAAKAGWVPGAEDILGIYDGVSFTVDQADATLALANSLTLDELDHDLGLHARAAESIALAQPIATIDELSRLYYVGRSALTELKAVAASSDINEQY